MNPTIILTTLLCLSTFPAQATDMANSSNSSAKLTEKKSQTIVVKKLPGSTTTSFRIVYESKTPLNNLPEFIHFDAESSSYYIAQEIQSASDESVRSELKKSISALKKYDAISNIIVVIVGNCAEDSIKAFVSKELKQLSTQNIVAQNKNSYETCSVTIQTTNERPFTLKDLWINRILTDFLASQIKSSAPATFQIAESDPSSISNVISIKPYSTLSSQVKEELDLLVKNYSLKGISLADLDSYKEHYLEQLEEQKKDSSLHFSSVLAEYITEQVQLGKSSFSFEDYLSYSPDVIKHITLSDINDALKDKRFLYTFKPSLSTIEASAISTDSARSNTSKETIVHDDEELISPSKTTSPFDYLEPESSADNNHAKRTESFSMYFAEEQAPVDPYSSLPITDFESKIIRNIIHTLAENNPIKLAFKEKELRRMEDQIRHVHPLRFLSVIFSNPELRSDMKKVMSNSFKYNGFLGGLSGSMSKQYNHNNLIQHVPGFSQHVNVDSNAVTNYIQRKDWNGLVHYLSKNAH